MVTEKPEPRLLREIVDGIHESETIRDTRLNAVGQAPRLATRRRPLRKAIDLDTKAAGHSRALSDLGLEDRSRIQRLVQILAIGVGEGVADGFEHAVVLLDEVVGAVGIVLDGMADSVVDREPRLPDEAHHVGEHVPQPLGARDGLAVHGHRAEAAGELLHRGQLVAQAKDRAVRLSGLVPGANVAHEVEQAAEPCVDAGCLGGDGRGGVLVTDADHDAFGDLLTVDEDLRVGLLRVDQRPLQYGDCPFESDRFRRAGCGLGLRQHAETVLQGVQEPRLVEPI